MVVDIPVGLADVGPWGLVVLTWGAVVFGILRGVLVPRSTFQTFVEAWETERAANAELEGQVAELLELGRTTASVLRSIQAAAERNDDGGGS